MFPLKVYIPYLIVSYFCLFFIIHAFFSSACLRVNFIGIIGWLTVFGVLLIIRILDELKDIETDQILFPNRPLPRGAVKYRDIKLLVFTILIIIVTLNLFLEWVIIPFVIMLFYIWLSFKWFYLRKIISDSLFLTLFSHQPITLMVNIYIVSTALLSIGIKRFDFLEILAVLAFFFPITAWETSRKIRAPGRETEYVTYSKLLGPKKAALLPLISLIISIGLFAYLGVNLQFSNWFFVALSIILVYILFFYIRFMIQPSERHLILKPVAELSGILFILVFLIQLIIKYGICWIKIQTLS